VTSEEAGRIDAIRAQRPNLLDIGLLLERGDALQAVLTDPDVQISRFRFFMEEPRSRWCR
jgi:hypothetical protein